MPSQSPLEKTEPLSRDDANAPPAGAGAGNHSRAAGLFAALLLAGLVIRILHGISSWQENPASRPLSADPLYYFQWSEEIAQGRFTTERPLYMPPLYPYLLAGLRILTGGELLPAALLFQALLGLAGLALLYRIARRAFNGPAACWAVLIALFYAPLLFYEGKLLVESLAVFLGLACIALLQDLSKNASCRRALAAGLALGLLCEARPNLLLFALPVLALAPFMLRRTGFSRIKPAALLGAGLALPLAFSFGYNLIVAGEPILITGNGGINFYFGNQAGASGLNDAPTRDFSSIFDQKAASARIAEQEKGRPLSQAEVSSFWRNRGLVEIAEDPASWGLLLFRKLRLFLSSFEYGVIALPEAEARFSWVQRFLFLPAGLLLALIAGGLWIALREKTPGLWPLLLFMAANAATVMIFFMAGRFRLPFLVAGLPFAGLFVQRGLSLLRGRRFGALAAGAGITAAFTAASFLLVDGRAKDAQLARAHVSLATAFQGQGRYEQARIEIAASLARLPTAAAFHRLGEIERAQGRIIEAISAFEEASVRDPSFLDPLDGLASIYEKERDWESALEYRARMIDLAPHRFETHLNYGLTCIEAGRLQDGARRLDRAAELGPANADAWEEIGKGYQAAGEAGKALFAFQEALRIDPGRKPRLEERMERLERRLDVLREPGEAGKGG